MHISSSPLRLFLRHSINGREGAESGGPSCKVTIAIAAVWFLGIDYSMIGRNSAPNKRYPWPQGVDDQTLDADNDVDLFPTAIPERARDNDDDRYPMALLLPHTGRL